MEKSSLKSMDYLLSYFVFISSSIFFTKILLQGRLFSIQPRTTTNNNYEKHKNFIFNYVNALQNKVLTLFPGFYENNSRPTIKTYNIPTVASHLNISIFLNAIVFLVKTRNIFIIVLWLKIQGRIC